MRFVANKKEFIIKSKDKKLNVVITGASSGIGKQLYDNFVKAGHSVICVQRTNPFNAENFVYCDFSNEQDILNAVNVIKQKFSVIHSLIINAGYGISGATELIDNDEVKRIMHVNYLGAIFFTKALIATTSENAHISFISSACALFPLPFRGIYCSSKSAVNMLAFSLKMELPPSYTVKCICPGDIKTSFSANRVKNTQTNSRYLNRVSSAMEYIDKREDKRMNEVKACKKIYKICLKGKKPLYIIGAKYKLFNFFYRILPVSAWLKITNKLFGGKKA